MKAFLAVLLIIVSLAPAPLLAAEAAPAKLPEPTTEQRLADIEAYFHNAARPTDGKAVSKIPVAGPGHNAWMMVSAGLVLFMTLPGLSLFYGGLVRRRNVLSVLAQCLALTGVVAVLWWAVGYSLSFGRGGGGAGRAGLRVYEGR